MEIPAENRLCLIFKENRVLITIRNDDDDDNDTVNGVYDSCWLIFLTALAFL